MTLEDYNLGRLRESILDEFGRDKDNPDLIRVANGKINDAIERICLMRADWPWLLNYLNIDISPSTTIVGDVIQGSRVIQNVIGSSTTHLRSIIYSTVGTNPVFGYTINSINGPTYTILGQWLDAGATGKTITVSTGYLQLPDDYNKMKILRATETLSQVSFHYRDPLEFSTIVAKRNIVGLYKYYYTITPDPIGKSSAMFISVYPYIDVRTNLIGSYWKRIARLEQDTDIPVIPGKDRTAILDLSYYLMSRYLKEDSAIVISYKKFSDESIALMEQGYDLSSEPERVREYNRGQLDFIQSPAGYPNFRSF